MGIPHLLACPHTDLKSTSHRFKIDFLEGIRDQGKDRTLFLLLLESTLTILIRKLHYYYFSSMNLSICNIVVVPSTDREGSCDWKWDMQCLSSQKPPLDWRGVSPPWYWNAISTFLKCYIYFYRRYFPCGLNTVPLVVPIALPLYLNPFILQTLFLLPIGFHLNGTGIWLEKIQNLFLCLRIPSRSIAICSNQPLNI